MAGLNKVTLIGNLGADPEVMTFENGVKKASLRIATTESYKGKDGNWVDETEWHNVVLWRFLAERNLVKGDTIYLEGKLKTRSWEDDKGQKRYVTEIFGSKIIKLSGNRAAGEGGAPSFNPSETKPQPQADKTILEESSEDDLPF